MTDRELFDAARQLPDAAAQSKFLEDTCRDDPVQLQRVRELLAAAGRRREPDITQDHIPDESDRPIETVQPAHSIGDVQTVTADRGGPTGPAGSPSTHELGMVIAGRYKLIEVIGEGGMGSV